MLLYKSIYCLGYPGYLCFGSSQRYGQTEYSSTDLLRQRAALALQVVAHGRLIDRCHRIMYFGAYLVRQQPLPQGISLAVADMKNMMHIKKAGLLNR